MPERVPPPVNAPRRFEAALAASLFALALVLRLRDPVSTPIIGAEDPYTHMVFVKELVAEGAVGRADALNLRPYPPGLHALVGVFWIFSGLPLHDLARFGPPVLGAAAVLALAALVSESWGLTAGVAAGALAATTPEHVFRTVLLFPTVLDLLLVPLILLFAVRATRATGGPVAPNVVALVVLGLALAVIHPWAVLLLAPALTVFLLARLLLPAGGETPARPAGGVIALLVVPALVAFTLVRFADTPLFGRTRPSELPDAFTGAPFLFLVGVAVATLGLGVLEVAVRRTRRHAPRARRWVRYPLALVAAGVVGLVLVVRTPGTAPPLVDYMRTLGMPLIVLGTLGLAVGLARRDAVAEAVAAFTAVVLPLTAFPLVHATVVPHRSVVYLALALAAFGGIAIGGLVHALAALASRWRGVPRPGASRAVTAGAGAVALVVLVAATVPAAAETERWYRYYSEHEYVVVDAAIRVLDEDPDAVVLVGAWQPNLFLRALADAGRVQWAPYAFTDPGERHERVSALTSEGAHVFMLADHHTTEERGLASDPHAGPLPEFGHATVASCCDGRGALYRVG